MQPAPSPTVEDSSPVHPLEYVEVTARGITFSLTLFDKRDYALYVADQSPLGEKWKSAREASESLRGVAAINGGFFKEDGSPLGLVRWQGKSSGAWNTSSSLASGVYQLSNEQATLQRNRSADRRAEELLQTGPFLLENSLPVSGLSTRRTAQRSILLWDGKNHFGLGVTTACTLSDLSTALQELPTAVPQRTVLNLDGGRSTDFYVSPKVKNGGQVKGHWLKSQVRNYLVLRKK